MFYQLPPVGNPVKLQTGGDELDIALPDSLAVFSGWQLHFYDSGTAALAAAMIAARLKKFGADCLAPAEVILPAYGCPDLVSAAVFAGLIPVLVDLEKSRPWLDLDAVSNAVSVNTVAIVAVDLFGIQERLSALRVITEKAGIVLIEDSAQSFPAEQMTQSGKRYWQGDMVVLSFGRGKPVSLLGGGLVLSVSGETALSALLPVVLPVKSTLRQSLNYRLKVYLYNLMIHPRLYWLPDSLPFLHLGETRYHVLHGLKGMDDGRKKILLNNIYAYYQYDTHALRLTEFLRRELAENNHIIDLASVCGMPASQRLLRYPLLLPATKRDTVVQYLKIRGMGPSVMYATSLPVIDGVKSLLSRSITFPNAEDFAARLLTLPTHGQFLLSHIRILIACITSTWLQIKG